MKKIYFGLILLSTMAFNTSVLADDNQQTTQTTTTEESIIVESSTETTSTKEAVTSESSNLKEATQTEISEAKEIDVTPKAKVASPTITKETTPAQGPYIADGSYVKITKKNYDIWQNFNWKKKSNTTNHYGKVYLAKGRYEHKNGQTYYSLFNNKDQWVGYLNANATTKTVAQGPYIADGTYVKFKKGNYPAW